MNILLLPFINIDPVAFSIGPIDVFWYGIAYLLGLLAAWKYGAYLGRLSPRAIEAKHFDNLLFWLVIGIILGGRLGYVLFYNFEAYLNAPLTIFYTWQGGMAFHGGLIGVIIALYWYGRKHKLPLMQLGDCFASAVPIGLFLGRIANYLNGELYGRVTDASWGTVFPGAGPEPRHPSQLYEAGLEGLALGIILFMLNRREKYRQKPGFMVGVFLIGYAIARLIVENFREPDAQIGYLWQYFTMGQLLTLFMIPLGIFFLYIAGRKNASHGKI
jgi:phosphatidylglycerol---prolipoprotein diacylglyceryl transferase